MNLKYWEVTLPKPPTKCKTRRLIVDWVLAESWPNHEGPLMSVDRLVIIHNHPVTQFAIHETHAYIHNAGGNKKTFDVSIEFYNSQGDCLKKTFLVPREVQQ